MGPVIKTEDLWFAYEENKWILKKINLEIFPGETVSIIGPNGCGKTTLVKHFNGLLKPTRGKVFINGIDTTKASIAELSRIVGYVFQNPNYQIFSTNIFEEVSFGPKNFGIKKLREVVVTALTEVGLEDKIKSSPFLLSHGEKERLAIASILAVNPQVLILDEPTTGQDTFTTQRMLRIVKKMKRDKKVVIIITHDLELVVECSDRVLVMNNGRIVKDDNPYSIFSDEKLLKKLQLPLPPVMIVGKSLGMIPPPLTLKEFERRFKDEVNRV